MKKQQTFKPKRGQIPTKFCSTCSHCTGDCYCTTHNRRIEKNYNRCFFHSNYQPQQQTFKVNPVLDEIIKQEQEVEKKRQQGWITEHNKMVDEIKKEINLAKALRKKSA